jgi:limonene 1,2-monooxygenase
MENVKFGFERYLDYLNNNQLRFNLPKGYDAAEWFIENKFGVIGTPDDAIALIERLYAKQDDFGVFLQQVHNWADFDETKRSYELYQRYVMPHLSRDNQPRTESFDWCTDHRYLLSERRASAARMMFDKHEAEQKAKEAASEVARPISGKDSVVDSRYENAASMRALV